MYFPTLLTIAPILLSMLHPSVATAANTSTFSPPKTDFLFTANLQLGTPMPLIDVPGGQRLVESIASGTITGPALIATLTGGVAFPIFRNGMKEEEPDIIVYGRTNKNGTFFATLQGVGSADEQWSRIIIEVGAPYAYLNQSFVLGQIVRGEGGNIAVNAFLVELES